MSQFIKGASKSYKKAIPNASNVNDANDSTVMWKTHFESLLNKDVNTQMQICIM